MTLEQAKQIADHPENHPIQLLLGAEYHLKHDRRLVARMRNADDRARQRYEDRLQRLQDQIEAIRNQDEARRI
jgi:hypothetical protein